MAKQKSIDTDELSSSDLNTLLFIRDEVMDIRIQLDMTQKEFAEAVRLSRASINRFEVVGEITLEVAFRLYYAMDKISRNIYVGRDVQEKCINLKNLIEQHVILKSNKKGYNAVSYQHSQNVG